MKYSSQNIEKMILMIVGIAVGIGLISAAFILNPQPSLPPFQLWAPEVFVNTSQGAYVLSIIMIGGVLLLAVGLIIRVHNWYISYKSR